MEIFRAVWLESRNQMAFINKWGDSEERGGVGSQKGEGNGGAVTIATTGLFKETRDYYPYLGELNMGKFAVIGAGPVGGIAGAHLAGAGHEVILVDRLESRLDAIRKNGLSIVGCREMNVAFPEGNLCNSITALEGRGIDYTLISVKASILQKILDQAKEVSEPDTTFVSVQNGLDTEDVIARAFGEENTLRVVVNYAGNMADDSVIRMSFFNPPNYVGAGAGQAYGKAEQLAQAITSAGLDTEFTHDIKKYEWEKTILNAALSPMSALTRKTMKQLMDFADTRDLAKEILRESIAVARANSIGLDPDFIGFCMGYLGKAGHHKTSMLVDLENSAPTEIDFINGKVVEYGRKRGVSTPYNSTIVALVRGSEMKEGKKLPAVSKTTTCLFNNPCLIYAQGEGNKTIRRSATMGDKEEEIRRNREMFYGFDGGIEMERNMPEPEEKRTPAPKTEASRTDYKEAEDAALFKGFDGGAEMDPLGRVRVSEKARTVIGKHDPQLDGFYDGLQHRHVARIDEAPEEVREKLLEFYADRLALGESTGNACVVPDFKDELRSGLTARVKTVRQVVADIEENAAKSDRLRYATGMNLY